MTEVGSTSPRRSVGFSDLATHACVTRCEQLQIFFFQVCEIVSAQDLPHFVDPDVAQASVKSVYFFSEQLGLDG